MRRRWRNQAGQGRLSQEKRSHRIGDFAGSKKASRYGIVQPRIAQDLESAVDKSSVYFIGRLRWIVGGRQIGVRARSRRSVVEGESDDTTGSEYTCHFGQGHCLIRSCKVLDDRTANNPSDAVGSDAR